MKLFKVSRLSSAYNFITTLLCCNSCLNVGTKLKINSHYCVQTIYNPILNSKIEHKSKLTIWFLRVKNLTLMIYVLNIANKISFDLYTNSTYIWTKKCSILYGIFFRNVCINNSLWRKDFFLLYLSDHHSYRPVSAIPPV